MKTFWTRMSNTGIKANMHKDLVKKIKITNQIVFSLSLIAFCYLFIFYFMGFEKEGIAVILIVASMITPLLLNHYGLFVLARVLFLVAINLAVLIYSFIFGAGAGIQFAYFSFVSLPWLIFEFKDRKYITTGVFLPMAGYYIIEYSNANPTVGITPELQHLIYISIVFVVFLILSLSMMFFTYQHFLSEKILIGSNTALVANRQKLELRNRKLEEIAWIQSHKLRKPVATILGLIGLINYENLSDPENEVTLKHIKTAGDELDDIIAEIDKKTRIDDE